MHFDFVLVHYNNTVTFEAEMEYNLIRTIYYTTVADIWRSNSDFVYVSKLNIELNICVMRSMMIALCTCFN